MSSKVSTTVQSSILHDLLQMGYAHIQPNYYFETAMNENNNYLEQVQSTYDKLSKDSSPGNRYRAYMKLNWCPVKQNYIRNANNDYFQSKEYNYSDGGKIRKFDVIDDLYFNSSLIQSLLEKDIDIARKTNIFLFDSHTEIGLHQIRYEPSITQAAYSSPIWLHKDDEPLVFVHLLNITKNLMGGDNLIAPDKETISNVLRLSVPLETLLIGQNIYHAVTPMGCSNADIGYRDILLVTFQQKKPEVEGE